MKICFLSSMHPPRDKRVFDKEAISLVKVGFQVIHIAPGEEGDIIDRGIRLKTFNSSKGLLGRIRRLPLLYRLAIGVNADVYHCNEVDSWIVGVVLKITHKKKIVFDVHEHYPSTFAESRFSKWLQPVVSGMVRLVFRILIPFTDNIVLAKRSVACDFMGSESKQVLVQNYTRLNTHVVNRKANPNCNTDKKMIIIHLGLISRIRGWPQLLEALVNTKSQNITLHIVGTFNDNSYEMFKAHVEKLNLGGRVVVEEWMPFEEAYKRLLCADVGVILFQPGIQNHVYALPHKLFDYMLAGIPVIVPSFAREVAEIVTNSKCGFLIDPNQPNEITKVLDFLEENKNERYRLGENGRRAVLKRYNWEQEEQKLINMYRQLAVTLES